MLYPSTPAPSYPVSITARWHNLVSQFDSGKEQRRQKQIQDLYDVVLQYNKLTLTSVGVLWDFYQSCKGTLESFYFYDLTENRRTWVEVYIGIADGITTIYDIPGKNTSSQSIYLDGSLQGSGYTILTGGGTESADRVQFTTAPASGAIITTSFTGDLRIKCRFKEDELTYKNFVYRLFETGLELYGLPV